MPPIRLFCNILKYLDLSLFGLNLLIFSLILNFKEAFASYAQVHFSQNNDSTQQVCIVDLAFKVSRSQSSLCGYLCVNT